ncbi:MAG: hypothetical protein QG580_32 [Patescibacteria group bacterium]|jgi:transcription elongation factor GreA-like protein|nr:hypothetical protein [Patescibacteria group bacterium]
MEAREELTPTEWFSFLEREETREYEWKRILDKFTNDRSAILNAFLGMEDGQAKDAVAVLLEDSFMYFHQEPQYEEAMRVAGTVPRDSDII